MSLEPAFKSARSCLPTLEEATMARKTEQDQSSEILEEGHIYFAYRPKVHAAGDDEEPVEGIGDARISTSCSSRTAAASG